MAEEFQESEVIFQEQDHEGNDLGYHDKDHLHSFCHHVLRDERSRHLCNTNKKSRKTKQKKSDSVPVDIPPSNVFQLADFEHDLEGELGQDDDELVLPHVIVGRRVFAGKMAFSVCTGSGRTLKGRDLSQVRNSILRMTGFLES